MLPKSPGFTVSEDVTHKMQAGSPGFTVSEDVTHKMQAECPGLTDPEDVTHKMQAESPGLTDPEDVTHKMQAGSPGLTEADVDSKKSSPIDFSRVFDTRRDCESPHGSCRRRQRDSRERSPMTS